MRARLALLAWVTGAAAALLLLSSAASTLPGPPIGDGDALRQWVEADGGSRAALACLRLLGVALAWYLLGTTVLAVVARLTGWVAAISLTDAVAVPAVRRVIESALAVGLTFGAVPQTAPSAVPIAQVSEAEPETATLRLLDPPAAKPAPAPTTPRTHVVQPGDHLWSIAERTLTTDLGRPPSEPEVVVYWRALIERNAGAFAGGDPDLIFPGQTLTLP